MDIEKIAAVVHLAYCTERLKQGKERYWTGGDYDKLDDATKEYDRVTIRAVLKEIDYDQLKAELEKRQKALERIQRWSRAYPFKVFPKPDLKKAHKVLKAAGMNLDAISADNMRHVLNGVKDIVEQALKEK